MVSILTPEPDTWLLIRSVTKYPNPAVPPVIQVDWYQRVNVIGDGEPRAGFAHWRGAGYTEFLEYEILQTVVLSKTQCVFDLDFSVTTQYEELIATGVRLQQRGHDTGWLSPTLEWHPCHFMEHDVYANYVLKETKYSLYQHEWIHVYEGMTSCHTTMEQDKWFQNQGWRCLP